MMKKLPLALLFFIFVTPITAEVIGKGQIAESLNICKSSRNGRLAVVTDTVDGEPVVDGGGESPIFAICKSSNGGSTWVWERIGGGGSSGAVLLAGDADGQTIQGMTGANKARIEIGEESAPNGVYIWGATAPGHVSAPSVLVDDGYFSTQSEDTNTNFSVTNGALNGVSDNSISFSVNPTGGYFGATPTNFYAGSPSAATSIDLSDSAFRVTYGQTPPTNANDACTAGDTIDTATFHYYCAATDTWVRVAMATWP